jgi:hypothetical protein
MPAEPASRAEHAMAAELDSATGMIRLTCTCGETVSGRLIEVLEMWAEWHLRTSEAAKSE